MGKSLTSKNILYSKDNCPWCDKAKELLGKNKIEYQEIKVNFDITRDRFSEIMKPYNLERLTVPQVFIGDIFIGGYEDLKKVI